MFSYDTQTGNDPHNLTAFTDRNQNTEKTYAYDTTGRLIQKTDGSLSSETTIDYSPAEDIFSDTCDDAAYNDANWTKTNVQLVSPGYGGTGTAMGLVNASSAAHGFDSPETQVTKISFYILNSSNKPWTVRVFDNRYGLDYGPVLTYDTALKAEIIYETALNYINIGSLSATQWHKIEMEADGEKNKSDVLVYRLWIDAVYKGLFSYKNTHYVNGKPDVYLNTLSFSTPSGSSGGDILIDNVRIEEIIDDGTMKATADAQGNQEIFTELPGLNEFGGKTWQFEQAGACASCNQASIKEYHYDDMWRLRRTIDVNDIITEMSYDGRGNMTSKTTAKNTAFERTTAWTYDSTYNKVLTKTEGSIDTQGQNKVTTYSYDMPTATCCRKL